MQDISKLCANHLRAFSEKQGIKLKASHAHELVAAFFGYQSRAALLADKQYPLSNLYKANIIVLTPITIMAQRLKNLDGLPATLPDALTLHESIYASLVLEKSLASDFWPYHDIEKKAINLAYEHLCNSSFDNIRSPVMPRNLGIKILSSGIYVSLASYYPTNTSWKEYSRSSPDQNMIITIWLQRVAAKIGYAKPEISLSVPSPKFNFEGINRD